ncbi:MAG TPA: AAA family ATPase [Candidatus Sulfotelmatobacter sp.]
MPVLIVFGGLSAAGKTTIARELARQIGAMHLRIDSIEQALRDSGAVPEPLNDVGYRIGYAVAEDNLRIGRTVVADSVNPLALHPGCLGRSREKSARQRRRDRSQMFRPERTSTPGANQIE